MADEKLELGGEEEQSLDVGGIPVAVALRVDENTKRWLLTLRIGNGCEKLKFNFGNYDGPTTKGGDPGYPPCP